MFEDKASAQAKAVQDLIVLFAEHRSEDECYKEILDALSSETPGRINIQPGRQSVQSALGTWQIREWTTRRAGTSTLGFERTLRNLAARPPDEEILGWGIDYSDKVYIVFASEDEEGRRELIGCIRVTKRPENSTSNFPDTR